MENKEPIDPLNFVLDDTDERPSADAMDDYYQKTEEALGQFMFLLFIPNSHTRSVEVYIDKGEYHTWYTIEEFGKKIKTICGVTEARHCPTLRVSCRFCCRLRHAHPSPIRPSRQRR